MSNYTHQTAPTQFVVPAGIRFAYRRFANLQRHFEFWRATNFSGSLLLR